MLPSLKSDAKTKVAFTKVPEILKRNSNPRKSTEAQTIHKVKIMKVGSAKGTGVETYTQRVKFSNEIVI